jgi:hypothetical protein
MELIALAVAFGLVFIPLFLASELAGSHPETARRTFAPPADAVSAAQRYLAANPLGPARPARAANDEHERLAA